MIIRRGEIYFVDLNPVQGREQQGRRPVLVVSADAINQQDLVVTVVVGTDGANIKRDYSTNVRVAASDSGLPLETVFLCFQIRSLDKRRFSGDAAGRLAASEMKRIEQALRITLGL